MEAPRRQPAHHRRLEAAAAPVAGEGRRRAASSACPPRPFPDAAEEQELSGTKYRVVPVVKGLANPWSLTFLPNGDMLVTEKAGRLRVVRKGNARSAGDHRDVPEVWAMGQGGLLEVLPHPRFADNQFLYLTYSKPCRDRAPRRRSSRQVRRQGADRREGSVRRGQLQHRQPALRLEARVRPRRHAVHDDRRARRSRPRAEHRIHGGKILRLKEDGTAPPDNPFVGKDGYKPEIFSYGHRNPQGLAFHPGTGVLWANEHGPQGGDELNIIQAGKNYGWPVASYGREYAPDGALVSMHPWKEGIEEPLVLWLPSIGISGMIFYTGDKFPQWKGHIFVGGLSGLALHRLAFSEKGGLLGREALLTAVAAAHPRCAAGAGRQHLRCRRCESRRHPPRGTGPGGHEFGWQIA